MILLINFQKIIPKAKLTKMFQIALKKKKISNPAPNPVIRLKKKTVTIKMSTETIQIS